MECIVEVAHSTQPEQSGAVLLARNLTTSSIPYGTTGANANTATGVGAGSPEICVDEYAVLAMDIVE